MHSYADAKRSTYCELSVPRMAEMFTDADDTYFLRIFSNKEPRLVDILADRQATAYSPSQNSY